MAKNYVIDINMVKNKTQIQFEQYKRIFELCAQSSEVRVIFWIDSLYGVENNLILPEIKEFFDEKRLRAKGQFVLEWDQINKLHGANNHFGAKDSTLFVMDDTQNWVVSGFKTTSEKAFLNLYNTLPVQNSADIAPVDAYLILKGELEGAEDKSTPESKTMLLNKYRPFIRDIVTNEEIRVVKNGWVRRDPSLIDLLFEKKQWPLLVTVLAMPEPEAEWINICKESTQKDLIQHPEAKLKKPLLWGLAISTEIINTRPLEKAEYLARSISKTTVLRSVLDQRNRAGIHIEINGLIEGEYKKVTHQHRPGTLQSLEAELKLLAEVTKMEINITREPYAWISASIEDCLAQLAAIHNKNVRDQKYKFIQESGLNAALHLQNWEGLVKLLVEISRPNWETLYGFMEDTNTALEVKALLVRASLIPAKSKNKSIKTLAHLLADHLVKLSEKEGDKVGYLQKALAESVLGLILDGDAAVKANFIPQADNSAKIRIETIICDTKADWELDKLFNEQPRPEIAIFKILAATDQKDLLPCKSATAKSIKKAYKEKGLAQMIVTHLGESITQHERSTTNVVNVLDQLLKNPQSHLMQMLGSTVELLRIQRQIWSKRAYVEQIEAYSLPEPTDNPNYAKFFKLFQDELKGIIEQKCILYLKDAPSFSLMAKNEDQMKSELEALRALSVAMATLECEIPPPGSIYPGFTEVLQNRVAKVKKDNPEGFKKHGSGTKAPKIEVFCEKLLSTADGLLVQSLQASPQSLY